MPSSAATSTSPPWPPPSIPPCIATAPFGRIAAMPDQSLVLEIEPTPHGAIVRCRGRLVAGVTDQMYTQVRALMPDAKHLVLDLTDLTHMDSMGLGVIVRLYVSAK